MSRVCDRFEPELSALIDGELSPALAAGVREHVRVCAACSAELERLRGVGLVLRRWDAQETRYAASHALRGRVFDALGLEDRSAAVPPQSRSLRLFSRAAAAALLLLAAGAAGAMIAPALRGGDDAGLAALQHEIESLKTQMAVVAADGRPAEPIHATAGGTVAPMEPWEPVVSSSKDAPAAARPSAPPVVDAWEQYGDHLIHPEAFGDYDRFDNLRRDLDLRRQMRDLEARVEPTAARPTGDGPPPTPMGAFLGTLRVAEGEFSAYEQVQVWPILSDGGMRGAEAPLTASEALRKGVLRVKEGGVADAFVVENLHPAGRPVLILAGDVFHGGRRDRVAREDVLVLPGPERYVRAATSGDPHRRRSLTFSRSDGLAPAGIRALLAHGAGQAAVDQASTASMTWLGSVSRVGSLDFVFENDQLQKRADRYVSAFRQRLSGADVVGFAVTGGAEVLGVEVFGDHATFAALGDRVLRSYMLEALARPRLLGDSPVRDTVVATLGAGRRAATTVTRGDVSTFLDLSSDVLGYGLASGSRVVHAVIFTGASTGPGATGPGRGRPDTAGTLGGTGPLDEGDGAGDPGRGSADGGGIKPSER